MLTIAEQHKLKANGVESAMMKPGYATKNFHRVYIEGGFMYKPTCDMFTQRGYNIVKEPGDADIIVWLGGSDVNPLMYNQKAISGTVFSSDRDAKETQLFADHVHTKALVGICRGAQLLHVLNGGTLWQDIDKHNDGGLHYVIDEPTNATLRVNTLHHQQMRLNTAQMASGKVVCVASCALATYKATDQEVWQYNLQEGLDDDHIKNAKDVEVLYYPGTKSLCFQPHPEFNHLPTQDYFFELIERYLEPITV